jgi:putative serine protease PepD
MSETNQYPSYASHPQPAPAAPPPAPRHLGGLVAGVLALSLLAGGGAGVAGAAAWDAWGGGQGDEPNRVVERDDAVSTAASDDGDAVTTAGPLDVESVAAEVLPSVVKLDVTGAGGSGSGSGIVLSEDGRIVTNNHVVEAAAQGGEIVVSFDDGSHAPAEVVGTDPLTDVAVVQAEGVSGLTPATMGESADLAVGEPVVAVGSPYGLDATVTSGIVSALDRPVAVGSDGRGNVTAYPAVQTDAAINPGNSGGPLVDAQGRVIGINASIRSTATMGGQAGSIGLGFAIPIDEVLPIVDQIVAGETPTHARLGVTVRPASAGTPGGEVTDGALIASVADGSAAGEAGLEPGDVVTAVEDRAITDSEALIAIIRSYRPGDAVDVTYLRDGEERTARVTFNSDAASSDG